MNNKKTTKLTTYYMMDPTEESYVVLEAETPVKALLDCFDPENYDDCDQFLVFEAKQGKIFYPKHVKTFEEE